MVRGHFIICDYPLLASFPHRIGNEWFYKLLEWVSLWSICLKYNEFHFLLSQSNRTRTSFLIHRTYFPSIRTCACFFFLFLPLLRCVQLVFRTSWNKVQLLFVHLQNLNKDISQKTIWSKVCLRITCRTFSTIPPDFFISLKSINQFYLCSVQDFSPSSGHWLFLI
jgi:hypothetical protein